MTKLGGADDRFGNHSKGLLGQLALPKWMQSTLEHKIYQTYYQNFQV